MIRRVIRAAKKLFSTPEAKNIFSHKASGELCAVCGKPMHTEQGILRVGSGEKMHNDCWSEFFKMRAEQIFLKHGAKDDDTRHR
ncbi:hypothetical protein [Pseudomonas sp.]|uniref:hypothetical protein n=1 Tax=Pseudomonas sp. TaxID=306 RepID=UPI002583D8F9|nr:hypothetical protein [Pseudomonas sp.]